MLPAKSDSDARSLNELAHQQGAGGAVLARKVHLKGRTGAVLLADAPEPREVSHGEAAKVARDAKLVQQNVDGVHGELDLAVGAEEHALAHHAPLRIACYTIKGPRHVEAEDAADFHHARGPELVGEHARCGVEEVAAASVAVAALGGCEDDALRVLLLLLVDQGEEADYFSGKSGFDGGWGEDGEGAPVRECQEEIGTNDFGVERCAAGVEDVAEVEEWCGMLYG